MTVVMVRDDPTINARNLGDAVPPVVAVDEIARRGGAGLERAAKRRLSGVVRVCGEPLCRTRLSSYNDSDRCWLHDA